VTANVARSTEEAEKQARGEAVGQAADQAEAELEEVPVFGQEDPSAPL
jgi:hypothetical protein